MAKLYFVRHGKAAAGFGAHADPGLDGKGEQQAKKVAEKLSQLPQMRIISSPLLRAQETSLPLCSLWDTEAQIEPSIAEIPSPTTDLAERSTWLGGVMQDTWNNLDAELHAWRDTMIAYLLSIEEDCVLFSHFIAINVAVGHANKDGRMISFRPDNVSCTVLSNDGGSLRILELGAEAETHVN
jgi:broad specificity phosphatase PhoE